MPEVRPVKYAHLYRVGFTPWERYGPHVAASLTGLLDRVESERPDPPGRALDLGCGRGQYTPVLARRRWSAVGVDLVPRAIDAARRADTDGATYVLGDVTDLSPDELGTFDLFLDVGCFQGLSPDQRTAAGRSVTRLAEPDAALLLLAFGPSRYRRLAEGASQAEIVAAFPGWDLLDVEDAPTAGLGWPMNRTRPQWFRLRRSAG